MALFPRLLCACLHSIHPAIFHSINYLLIFSITTISLFPHIFFTLATSFVRVLFFLFYFNKLLHYLFFIFRSKNWLPTASGELCRPSRLCRPGWIFETGIVFMLHPVSIFFLIWSPPHRLGSAFMCLSRSRRDQVFLGGGSDGVRLLSLVQLHGCHYRRVSPGRPF